MNLLVKICGYFVSLDMPDPATDWKQMLFCIGFVALVAIVMVAIMWAV